MGLFWVEAWPAAKFHQTVPAEHCIPVFVFVGRLLLAFFIYPQWSLFKKLETNKRRDCEMVTAVLCGWSVRARQLVVTAVLHGWSVRGCLPVVTAVLHGWSVRGCLPVVTAVLRGWSVRGCLPVVTAVLHGWSVRGCLPVVTAVLRGWSVRGCQQVVTRRLMLCFRSPQRDSAITFNMLLTSAIQVCRRKCWWAWQNQISSPLHPPSRCAGESVDEPGKTRSPAPSLPCLLGFRSLLGCFPPSKCPVRAESLHFSRITETASSGASHLV